MTDSTSNLSSTKAEAPDWAIAQVVKKMSESKYANTVRIHNDIMLAAAELARESVGDGYPREVARAALAAYYNWAMTNTRAADDGDGIEAAARVIESASRSVGGGVGDTARLDWLAHHGAALRCDPDNSKGWYIVAPYHTQIASVDGRVRFETPRAAIDAALAGVSEGKEQS